jgi:hypothetical protein
MADADELQQARRLFKAFHGRDPRGQEIAQLGPAAGVPVALEVGQLLSIGYKALGDGKAYFHEFDSPRAKVYVSPDGRQIFLAGGLYRFSDRGFIK